MASETRRVENPPSHKLLSREDAPPARIVNPQGGSPFLLIGDHAGNAVPASLGSLGLSEAEMTRHIAWDIGIAGLGEQLSATLDAVFIRQTYSRLVVDCNRDPQAADAIPVVSDGTLVPANQRLPPAEKAARVAEIHAPYQSAIADELARRDVAGLTSILISLHSFTPTMEGIARPWQVGVLHSGGDVGFALALLMLLQARDELTVGDNEPYRMDEIDHTVPRHAFVAHRPYVEIEIRQDLLATLPQRTAWARLLAELFADAASV